ncbi:MAG: hypothetical protein K0R65_3010 [Crocinitomicaceae bacterium]|jgi:two-component system response regulator NreC|nr:hypothetical protein [Crocinitomicaceae bacterium]
MTGTKIIIADDHTLILDGIKSMLEKVPEYSLLAAVDNGRELVAKTRILQPDLVITDIDMPVMDGNEAVKILHKEFPGLKILVLTMHHEKSMYLKLKASGAHGYIHKNCDKEELFFAIQQILKGKEYISSEIQPGETGSGNYRVEGSSVPVELTKREVEILGLIAEGLTNIEIGEKLFISHRTVDSHRTNLMRKLDVKNIAGLIRFAYSNGIVN